MGLHHAPTDCQQSNFAGFARGLYRCLRSRAGKWWQRCSESKSCRAKPTPLRPIGYFSGPQSRRDSRPQPTAKAIKPVTSAASQQDENRQMHMRLNYKSLFSLTLPILALCQPHRGVATAAMRGRVNTLAGPSCVARPALGPCKTVASGPCGRGPSVAPKPKECSDVTDCNRFSCRQHVC